MGRIPITLRVPDPLQNAKVMAREKQGEVGEKVMSMGKNPLNSTTVYFNAKQAGGGGGGRWNLPIGWFFRLLC